MIIITIIQIRGTYRPREDLVGGVILLKYLWVCLHDGLEVLSGSLIIAVRFAWCRAQVIRREIRQGRLDLGITMNSGEIKEEKRKALVISYLYISYMYGGIFTKEPVL